MAKEFVRNIKNTKLDSNEELKEPLYTNVQNDLLSDKKHAYIRNNDFYFPITKSILNVTEDSNIKNPLEYTKVIDGRTNEVTSHWNFNKLNNNFDSSLPITKSTYNDTIIYDLDFSDLFRHFEFDNIFLSATQDKDNIKIKFTPDVIYEKTNQDMIDKLEYLEQNMGQNLTTNFRNEFNKKIDDEINSKFAEYGLQRKKDKEELKKEIEDKIEDKIKELKKQSETVTTITNSMISNKLNIATSSVIDKGSYWAVPIKTDTNFYLVWAGVKIPFTHSDKGENPNLFVIDTSKLKDDYHLLVNANIDQSTPSSLLGYTIGQGYIYFDKTTIAQYLELERTAIIVNMNKSTITENNPNNYQELINKIELQNAVITEMGKRFDELRDEVYKNSNVIKQHSQDIIDLSKRISG